MGWTTPRTWVTSEIVTASQLNTHIRDNETFLGIPPLAVLRHSTTQSIPNNSQTACAFDTEDIDRDNGHSTVTNNSRYTAQTAGWYLVVAGAGFAGDATGTRQWILKVNGTANKGFTNNANPSASATHQQVAAPMFLDISDYAELYLFQNRGSALNTDITGSNPVMTVTLLSV